MTKIYLLIATLLLTLSSQAQDVLVESSGPVKEERIFGDNITNIRTSQNVNVFISQSGVNQLSVEVGHVDLLKKVKTTMERDTLVISVDEIYYTNKLYETPINVYVDIKTLNSIHAQTNSKVKVMTEISSDNFHIESSTKGHIEFTKGIHTNNLRLLSTLSSTVIAPVESSVNQAILNVGTKASVTMNIGAQTSLECYVTNSGVVDLRGSANNVLVTCQDRATVRMKDFSCEFANAFATYEGSIYIVPKNTLTATATYKGMVTTNKSVKNLIKSESFQGKVRN